MKCEICGKLIWGWDRFNVNYATSVRPLSNNGRIYKWYGFTVIKKRKKCEIYAHDTCVIKKAKEEDMRKTQIDLMKMKGYWDKKDVSKGTN